MMTYDLERKKYKFLKSKVIIGSDTSIKIEKPNFSNIPQKNTKLRLLKNFPYVIFNNEITKIISTSLQNLLFLKIVREEALLYSG